MGLVLVYRANRIVNFRGRVTRRARRRFSRRRSWSARSGASWAASGVGLLAAIVLGAGTEFPHHPRFAKAPRLILTVATIGLLELFAAGQLAPPEKLFNFHTRAAGRRCPSTSAGRGSPSRSMQDIC